MFTYKTARRVVIFIMGMTVVLFGTALLVLPGPGIVVIVLGLAILATEFAWAHHWLEQMKHSAGDAKQGVTRWWNSSENDSPPGEPDSAQKDETQSDETKHDSAKNDSAETKDAHPPS